MACPAKALLWAGAVAVALVAVWTWQHLGLGALLTLGRPAKRVRQLKKAPAGAASMGASRVGPGCCASWRA